MRVNYFSSTGKGKISRIRHIKSIIRELYLLGLAWAWVKCQFGAEFPEARVVRGIGMLVRGERGDPAGSQTVVLGLLSQQINPYLFDSSQSETRG